MGSPALIFTNVVPFGGTEERLGTAKEGQWMESNYMEKGDLKSQTPLKKMRGKHIFLKGFPRSYVEVQMQRFSLLTSSLGVAGFMSKMLILQLGVAGKSKTILSS